jgi:hypothetical protein
MRGIGRHPSGLHLTPVHGKAEGIRGHECQIHQGAESGEDDADHARRVWPPITPRPAAAPARPATMLVPGTVRLWLFPCPSSRAPSRLPYRHPWHRGPVSETIGPLGSPARDEPRRVRGDLVCHRRQSSRRGDARSGESSHRRPMTTAQPSVRSADDSRAEFRSSAVREGIVGGSEPPATPRGDEG